MVHVVVNLSIRKHVSGELHAAAALTLRKSLRYPFSRKQGGLQSQSESFGEEKCLFFFFAGNQIPDRSAHKLLIIPTELCTDPI